MTTSHNVAVLQARYGDLSYIELYLTYWRDINGVDIPDELFSQLVRAATAPGTIEREYRALRENRGGAT